MIKNRSFLFLIDKKKQKENKKGRIQPCRGGLTVICKSDVLFVSHNCRERNRKKKNYVDINISFGQHAI
jgi:hypothetical protein